MATETTLEIGKRMRLKHSGYNSRLKYRGQKRKLKLPMSDEEMKKKYKRRKPLSRARLAAKAVQYAIGDGDLPSISTQMCEHCGEQAHHYHHHSYKAVDWLDVVPLCADCHSFVHGFNIPTNS